ncbi:MAG TPA: aspartate aminotransferase [Betaproteobacteria bacterium]|jgi:3-hexulose-6-phosphate synthase / 6-phospho-3-hexuloisomerase|nr:aspartate aminotransferase [Betaproteobacteria bacterium]
MTDLDEIIEALKDIPTATLANALDDVGKFINSSVSIRPVEPSMRVVGRALTVEVEVGEAGTFSSHEFRVGAMIDRAEKGDVIVVAAKGAKASIWGGMASLAASVKGISGLVVDGSVRDVDEINACGFNVFSRYVIPTTGRTRLHVKSIGGPISLDGIAVESGDIIIGDSTGLVVIPHAKAFTVLEKATLYQKDDLQATAEIRRGISFTEVMKHFKRI